MSLLSIIIAMYSTTIIIKSSSVRDGSRLLLQHACSIDADCLNGGSCYTSPTQPNFCICVSGFAGPNCEIDIDDCDPNPCLNGGTCRDAVNSFSCTCAPGYTGDRCQTPPKDTSTNSAEHKPQITPSQPSTGNCPDNSFCSGKADGNYQNPDGFSQNYYSSCVAGQYLYCMSCPAGLVYNPTSDSCELSSTGPGTRAEPRGVQSGNGGNSGNGNAVSTSTSGKSAESKPSSSSSCPDSTFCSGKADGNYANPDGYSDNYFASCVAGKYLYCMECPAGLVYNANSDSCERSTTGPGTRAEPKGSQSVSRASSADGKPSGNGNLIKVAPSSSCPDSSFCAGKVDGNYGNPGNANIFISCVAGQVNCFQCPANLVFNPYLGNAGACSAYLSPPQPVNIPQPLPMQIPNPANTPYSVPIAVPNKVPGQIPQPQSGPYQVPIAVPQPLPIQIPQLQPVPRGN